jgi:hypothetical protein
MPKDQKPPIKKAEVYGQIGFPIDFPAENPKT